MQNGAWTYFIQAGDGPVKIGRATDVAARLRELQVGNPEKLKILCATKLLSEAQAHELFAEDRLRGEWFRPSEFLLNFALKMC